MTCQTEATKGIHHFMAEELGISAPPTGVFFFGKPGLRSLKAGGDEHPQLILDVKARQPRYLR